MERTVYNPLYKDSITFLKTSKETSGEFSELLLTVSKDGGNPLHIHANHAETFTSTKGTLGVTRGDKEIFIKPGESITIDKGVVHNFFNRSDQPCEARIVFRPGHEGMENTLRIAYGLARDGKTNSKGVPKDFYAAAVVFEMSDSRNPGIMFALIRPILKFLAKRARKKGIEQKLLDTYCR